MSRLFVAIDLDEAARDFIAAAIERLQQAGLDARFTTREKWHVTVAFLGPVAPEARATVAHRLQEDADKSSPFTLVLDTVGAFPNLRRPRVVWIGSSVEQPAYAACAARVRRGLTEEGFRFDDEAVPHVTVCRLKHHATPLPAATLQGKAAVHVERLTLYESVSAGSSTRYIPLESVALREPTRSSKDR